jgi:hypothetical protein
LHSPSPAPDDAYGVRSRGEIIRQHHALLVIEAVAVSDGEAIARHLCRPCALLAPERVPRSLITTRLPLQSRAMAEQAAQLDTLGE